MTLVPVILLKCLLAVSVQTQTHRHYQPFGPKMCQALYREQTRFTAWAFDELYLICRLRVNTSGYYANRDESSTRTRATEHRKINSNVLQGFLMQTERTLYHVDLAMRKKRLRMPMHNGDYNIYYYDREDGILYVVKQTGYIYHGVIRDHQVNFTEYRRLKVKFIVALAVDKENSMVGVIYNSISITLKCYNTLSRQPQRVAQEITSASFIHLDKQRRVVFFVQRLKLCSIDYHGRNKKRFNKITLRDSFSLAFQDQVIVCTSPVRKNLVTYKFDRTTGKTIITKRTLLCLPPNPRVVRHVIKVGDKIVLTAIADGDHRGVLVETGMKCDWIWDHLLVLAFLPLE